MKKIAIILSFMFCSAEISAQYDIAIHIATEPAKNLEKWIMLKRGREQKEDTNTTTEKVMLAANIIYQGYQAISTGHFGNLLKRNSRTLAKGAELVDETKKTVKLAREVLKDMDTAFEGSTMLIDKVEDIIDELSQQLSTIATILKTKKTKLTDKEIYVVLEGLTAQMKSTRWRLLRIKYGVTLAKGAKKNIKKDVELFKKIIGK